MAKAQASMEYLLMAAFIAMVVISSAFLFYNYASDSARDADNAQVNKLGNYIVNTAENVYYLGVPSRLTIEQRLPADVESMSIDYDATADTYLLAIAIRTGTDTSNLSFTTKVPLSAGFSAEDINPGVKRIRIEAEEDDAGEPVVLVSFHPQKRVFVSSATNNGNLGGLAGADAFCQGLADTAGIGGVWTAWLSTDTADAKSRILDTKYVLVDGTKIANNLADLTDGLIEGPIQADEQGNILAVSEFAWTGTTSSGESSGIHCSSWTGSGTGAYGETNSQNSWSQSSAAACGSLNHIYCFET